jgi:hypothetical protein
MKIKFGHIINFKHILSGVNYVITRNNPDIVNEVIIIKEDSDFLKYKLAEPIRRGFLDEIKYPSSFRKLFFREEEGTGIVIGQTTRAEGYYFPGCSPTFGEDYSDSEPPYLKSTKTFTFWVVATGMNQTVLVPKNYLI